MLTLYRQIPTPPKPSTTTTSKVTSVANTTIATTTDKPSDNSSKWLIVEIVVPCVVVIVVIVIVVIILIKRMRRKERDSIYNVKDTERTRGMLPEDNRISTLSSTPINPYELMSVYARMPAMTRETAKPETGKTNNETDDVMKQELIDGTNKDVTSNIDNKDSLYLYGKIEKRKQKKRMAAGQEGRDDPEDNFEALNTLQQTEADVNSRETLDNVSDGGKSVYGHEQNR